MNKRSSGRGSWMYGDLNYEHLSILLVLRMSHMIVSLDESRAMMTMLSESLSLEKSGRKHILRGWVIDVVEGDV